MDAWEDDSEPDEDDEEEDEGGLYKFPIARVKWHIALRRSKTKKITYGEYYVKYWKKRGRPAKYTVRAEMNGNLKY